MKTARQLLALQLVAVAFAFPADDLTRLEAIRELSNLQKRADRALKFADSAMDAARDAYKKGQAAEVRLALQNIEQAVVLAYDSLKATGKNPRKNSKPFKKAEIATRALLRQLNDFRTSVSYLERESVSKVIETVETVNGNLLRDVMGLGSDQ